jgi:2-amino-4-hydroxy-6-hydroxymethyldihydropteridine diphosphokinase
MFPIIDIGPLAFQAGGMILIISLLIGLWLSRRFAASLDTNGDAIENNLLLGLVVGIVGARLGFMLQNPSVLADNPLSLVSFTPSMLDIPFGLLAGALAIYITFQRRHLPLWPTLDTLSPLAILLFAGVHLANFANGNGYGLPTTLPWGVSLWNAIRHPVQIYALILSLALLIWLLLHTRLLKYTNTLHSGSIFTLTLAGLALITILTRALVAEKIPFLGMDLIQTIAWVVLLASLGLIFNFQYRQSKRTRVFLSLGSNRNPREQTYQASQDIAKFAKILHRSSLYETADVRPDHAGETYINRVLEVETDLPYPELKERTKAIESTHGRQPGDKEDVPMDIDILTYGRQVFVMPSGATIPKRGLIKHRYIALPLAEIAPDFRHPGTGIAIQNILKTLDPKKQPVQKITEVENGT